ncbi:diguanylate cyclase domain-containing protein [Thiohalophilus sp.]|uniref:diguanylate cyclase domain-containing protein n=1 Tax=Thiohalophilus sp. TaxID=3028392 RepID=UPI0039753E06
MISLLEPGREGAATMAERMREALKAMQIEPLEWKQTARFGVTELQREDDADRFLSRADEAMYEAKRSGRDRGCIL